MNIDAIWVLKKEMDVLRKDKEILIKENILLKKQLHHFAFLRKHCSFYKHTFDKNVKTRQIAMYDDDHKYLFTKSGRLDRCYSYIHGAEYDDELIYTYIHRAEYDDELIYTYTYEFKYIKQLHNHNAIYDKYKDIYDARTYVKGSKFNDLEKIHSGDYWKSSHNDKKWDHNKEKCNDDVMCIHLLNMLDCDGMGQGCEIYIHTPINEPMRLEIKFGHYIHYKFENGITIDHNGDISKHNRKDKVIRISNNDFIKIYMPHEPGWEDNCDPVIEIGNDNLITKKLTNKEIIYITKDNVINKNLPNNDNIYILNDNRIKKTLPNDEIIIITKDNLVAKQMKNKKQIQISKDNIVGYT